MSVAGFERVEGPLDQANVARQRFVALEELQHAADAAVAVRRENAGHVGVEIAGVAANGGHSESEANHGVAIERTDDLAAGLISDHERNVGLDLEIGFTPNALLDSDTPVKVVEGGAFADGDVGGHGTGVCCKLSVFSWGGEG